VPTLGVGAGAVHHHARLAEARREPLAEQPRQQIAAAARREGHHEVDRAGGKIGARRRGAGRKSGQAQQDIATAKRHAPSSPFVPLGPASLFGPTAVRTVDRVLAGPL